MVVCLGLPLFAQSRGKQVTQKELKAKIIDTREFQEMVKQHEETRAKMQKEYDEMVARRGEAYIAGNYASIARKDLPGEAIQSLFFSTVEKAKEEVRQYVLENYATSQTAEWEAVINEAAEETTLKEVYNEIERMDGYKVFHDVPFMEKRIYVFSVTSKVMSQKIEEKAKGRNLISEPTSIITEGVEEKVVKVYEKFPTENGTPTRSPFEGKLEQILKKKHELMLKQNGEYIEYRASDVSSILEKGENRFLSVREEVKEEIRKEILEKLVTHEMTEEQWEKIIESAAQKTTFEAVMREYANNTKQRKVNNTRNLIKLVMTKKIMGELLYMPVPFTRSELKELVKEHEKSLEKSGEVIMPVDPRPGF